MYVIVQDKTKKLCPVRVPERQFESATQARETIFIVIFSSHLLCFATWDWYSNSTESSGAALLEWLISSLKRPLAREESSSAVGGTSLVGESFSDAGKLLWRSPVECRD